MLARGSAFLLGLNRAPAKRAADRRSANQSNRCGCSFLFGKHNSQVRFAPSLAQGTDVIVAASPQGRLPRLMRSDEFGTKIAGPAPRSIDTVVATRGVPVSRGEGRNAKG